MEEMISLREYVFCWGGGGGKTRTHSDLSKLLLQAYASIQFLKIQL